jgi:flavin reductase (DIM6/NTAB) family NADH-FMN oxidoreductase RutF
MTRRSSSPELRAEADRFRDLMAGWPTGVAVVTCVAGGRPVGCTVTAVASVSTDPPLLLVSLATQSRTLEAIEDAGRFGICVLSTAQRRLAQTFATGEPALRFAGVPYRWVLGVPVLHGAMNVAVCAVQDEVPVADHVLVMGGPLWQAEDSAVAPVIWFRRGYWDLCPAGSPPGGSRRS